MSQHRNKSLHTPSQQSHQGAKQQSKSGVCKAQFCLTDQRMVGLGLSDSSVITSANYPVIAFLPHIPFSCSNPKNTPLNLARCKPLLLEMKTFSFLSSEGGDIMSQSHCYPLWEMGHHFNLWAGFICPPIHHGPI
jgi:hypothetical protein